MEMEGWNIAGEQMKGMLSTLLGSGTISVSDIASALYENKESKLMDEQIMNIPKIGFREDRGDYYITVPKKLSKTGKRYPIYGKTEDEVIQNYKLEVSLNNQGVEVGKEDTIPTLQSMVNYTMKNIIYHDIEETSYLSYESLCRNHIFNNEIALKKINEITYDDLKQYFNSTEISKMTGAAISSIFSILKRTFTQSKILKYITDNPIELVNVTYRNSKKPKRQKQRLIPSEIEKLEKSILVLCQVVPKYRYTPMFIVDIYTGLRLGEILGIKKSDVNFEQHKLSLARQLVYLPDRGKNLEKGNFSLKEKAPKYDSDRDVPLSKRAIYWIEFMMNMNKLDGFSSEYIFLNKLGRVPSRGSVNDIWHQLLEEVGIPYCTPHKLRKTFTTMLLNSGEVDLPSVASIVGHKHNSMTLDTYFTAIFDNTFEEKLPNKLDNIFDGNDNTMTTANAMDKLKQYTSVLP